MSEDLRKRHAEDLLDVTSKEQATKIDKRKKRAQRVCESLARKIIAVCLLVVFLLAILAYCVYSYALNLIYFRYGRPDDVNWQENDLLAKANYESQLKLFNPETILFSPDGHMIVGLMDGRIIRVNQSDGTVEQLADFSRFQRNRRLCDLKKATNHFFRTKCSIPLGLRFKPGTNILYVAVPFEGIFKTDIDTRKTNQVLKANDLRFGDRPLKLIADVDVAPDDMNQDGSIYFIDSSLRMKENDEEGVELIEEYPSGRLFRFNEAKDELELISDKFCFPNSIQLLPSGDALLLSELSKGRIIKVYLAGSEQGKMEIFADLPGLSSAIRMTDHYTILVSFMHAYPKEASLLSIFGQFRIFRALIGTILSPEQFLNSLPRYGLIAEFDLGGNLLHSWHDTEGIKFSHISSAAVHDQKIYVCSTDSNYIASLNHSSN